MARPIFDVIGATMVSRLPCAVLAWQRAQAPKGIPVIAPGVRSRRGLFRSRRLSHGSRDRLNVMTWLRPFAKPMALRDGRVIATLGEARAVIESLPPRRQHNEAWLYTDALLIEAATAKGSLNAARAQLTLALKAEGLI